MLWGAPWIRNVFLSNQRTKLGQGAAVCQYFVFILLKEKFKAEKLPEDGLICLKDVEMFLQKLG